MLHLLYILAFTIIAFLAISNLIRSLMSISYDYQYSATPRRAKPQVPHPEFLDNAGNVIEEPLLVMKSIGVEDARQKLESLYKNPPEGSSN
jgi:Protein of unknown function (DUF2973)